MDGKKMIRRVAAGLAALGLALGAFLVAPHHAAPARPVAAPGMFHNG